MKDIISVVMVICASALVCTIVTNFVSDGSMKKIINLILGAFMLCTMIAPLVNAIKTTKTQIDNGKSVQSIVSTSDEAYSKAVLNQTKENLEMTLKSLLNQNKIKIKDCNIVLSEEENKNIIISKISIYIDKSAYIYIDKIKSVTNENFSIIPEVLAE